MSLKKLLRIFLAYQYIIMCTYTYLEYYLEGADLEFRYDQCAVFVNDINVYFYIFTL